MLRWTCGPIGRLHRPTADSQRTWVELLFELGLATRAVALLDDPASDGGREILAELGAEETHMLPLG